MRMLPMGRFFTDGRYIIPDSLKNKTCSQIEVCGMDGAENEDKDAEEVFLNLMEQIEYVYNKLIEAGVAMEDARQIIPIGVTHGITWSLNLKAMMHILGKRACWVAQANLWENLIAGMVDELATKVDPIFRKIIQPPCFKQGKYKSCPYYQINRERVQGRDHMPPCPLYVYHETTQSIQASELSENDTGVKATWTPPNPEEFNYENGNMMHLRDIRDWNSSEPVEKRMLDENIVRFERLWKLNVMTGEPLVSA